MMLGFFGDFFDLNKDGNLDAGESFLDYMAYEDLMKEEAKDALAQRGVDVDTLKDMDEEERREQLVDAGVDPDAWDYDF